MDFAKTQRGFSLAEFKDRNGVACNMQESSLADEPCIWIGCKEIGLKKFTPYKGWEDVQLEHNPPYGITHLANTRMHLTQEMVRDLLPALTHFAETGALPSSDA